MTEKKKDARLGTLEFLPDGGTLVAEALVEHGVTIAFGVQGGHIWPMVDEMSRAGIKQITFTHEQSAAYAADGYAKVARRPAVAYGTVGPGVANAVSGIQQAFFGGSPMIFLAGGNPPESDYLPVIQPSYVLDLLRFITRWSARVTEPGIIKEYITRAFKDSQIYPKKPIALEIPAPVLLQPVAGLRNSTYVEKWRGPDTGAPVETQGDSALVARAVKLLFEAKKPLIFAGDGVHWSDAGEALVEFAEAAQIPCVTRRIARGAFPETHPFYVNHHAGKRAMKASDLRLSLGQKIGTFDEFGIGWPPTIQVNESMEHIWSYVKTPVAIVGSPRLVLQQMTQYIRANNLKPPASRGEWVKFCEETQKGVQQELDAKAEKYKDHMPLHFGYVAKVAWDVCEEMYGGMNRVILDGYSISAYALSFLKARYSGQIMDAGEQAGVGHGVGMAIGACFADPECYKRPVLSLMGDAGMRLAGTDYETAFIHKLPIVFLVTENQGWLTGMKYAIYGKDWGALGPQDREWGTGEATAARYEHMAKMFGGYGEYVGDPADMKSALQRAFRSAEKGVPAVLSVHCDPRVSNKTFYGAAYAAVWAHIPWNKLAKRGKALRRNMMPAFPWDEHGIPPMEIPDPWEPITDEEAQP